MSRLYRGVELIKDNPSFAVLLKPCNITTTPSNDVNAPSLVSIFREMFPGTISHPAVHRLDRATSGLVILAKNSRAHSELSRQFREREVYKEYRAILDGVVESPSGIIKLPFKTDPNNRPYQIFSEDGKMGITEYHLISCKNSKTELLFIPKTGRTHQLRVHSAHKLGLNCPIIGDNFYGKPAERLYLHASKIIFRDPINGETIELESEPNF